MTHLCLKCGNKLDEIGPDDTAFKEDVYQCPKCRCTYTVVYPESASSSERIVTTHDPSWFFPRSATEGD